jgi:hypothetical protein
MCSSLDEILMLSSSYVFVTVQNDLDPAAFQVASGRTVRVYLSLFILAYLFELVIAYDALRLSSMIQVVGICIYNLFLLAYASVQPLHIEKDLDALSKSLVMGIRPILPPDLGTWHRVRPILLAVISLQAVATAALLYLALQLRSELAWLVYKVINADVSMRRRLVNYQVSFSPITLLTLMFRKASSSNIVDTCRFTSLSSSLITFSS